MAVKSTEELMNTIREKLAEDNSDETISLIEDISDTLSDKDTKINDIGDWKTKYEENDKQWRKRYTDRFFSSDPTPDPEPEPEPESEKPKTYEDLFKVKE